MLVEVLGDYSGRCRIGGSINNSSCACWTKSLMSCSRRMHDLLWTSFHTTAETPSFDNTGRAIRDLPVFPSGGSPRHSQLSQCIHRLDSQNGSRYPFYGFSSWAGSDSLDGRSTDPSGGNADKQDRSERPRLARTRPYPPLVNDQHLERATPDASMDTRLLPAYCHHMVRSTL